METIENLLGLFREKGVSIQITLDYGRTPIVDAIYKGEYYRTEGFTLKVALQEMQEKLEQIN